MTKKKQPPPPTPNPAIERAKRKLHILGKLETAMRAIKDDPRYDWKRESEEIFTAADLMMQTVEEYIDGNAGEAEIKPLYKAYVELHAV